MSTIDASSKAAIINSTKLRGLFAWYRKWLLFRNEFIPVFISNEILVLERNFILVSSNWKRTSFWIENRKSCQSAGKWRMRAWSGAKTTRVRTPKAARRCYHVNAVQTGTELIPEWKSFRYHVNNMILNYPQITWLPVPFSKWINKS